eukprot:SAG31_NODE_14754_length_789_cov_0.960870_1_plen_78_part_10
MDIGLHSCAFTPSCGKDAPSPAAKVFGTPLIAAVSKGHVEFARRLIELGADVNAKGYDINERTPLIAAVEFDSQAGTP